MGCSSSTEVAAQKTSYPDVAKKDEKNVTADTEAMMTPRQSVVDTSSAIPLEGQGETLGEVTIGDKWTVRYAIKSQRGRDPDDSSKPNQDAFGVNEQFVNHKSSPNNAFFAGVYDGHGPTGQDCSHFARRQLPELISKYLQKAEEEAFFELTLDETHECLRKAHVECDSALHKSSINDLYSGTTAISLYIHDGHMTIGNVGDSRAVLGCPPPPSADNVQSPDSPKPRAVALSNDQTPKRLDEAQRCIAAGARILSFGQIDPKNHGDDGSDVEDPPRVWSKKGMYPGTAFTRSIGDAVAEEVGVTSEPECMTVEIPKGEILVILASDGVFDVMLNQDVVEICFRYRSNPDEACRKVLEKCHEEWLLNDDCTEEEASYDDMTIACIFIFDDTFVSSEKTNSVEKFATVKPHHSRPKRVRQKTLRHLEEMCEE